MVLSLISIVYPDDRVNGMEERRKTAEDCQQLFNEVRKKKRKEREGLIELQLVATLQTAQSKDERMELLPAGFWSGHKKEVRRIEKNEEKMIF